MNNLSIIQGDTLNVTLTIENPEELVIEKVLFTCPSLKINRQLTPLNTDDLWGFVISSEDTKTFRVGHWDYCITAVSDNSEVYTVIYNGTFEVQYKRNKGDSPVPPYIITGIGWTED